VTKRTNEADGNPADQPRSSLVGDRIATGGNDRRAGQNRALFAVPILVLIVTAIAIRTVNERADTPPRLQTVFTSRSTNVAPPVKSPERVEEEPVVRVNVTPGGVDSFQLEVRGPYELVSFDSHQTLFKDPPRGAVKVDANAAGLRLGARQFKVSRLEIRPTQSPAVRVNGHLYRGHVRLFRRSDGKVSAVNVLPIEEYLASVVDSEMPAKFPEAARQAQAIVARTYALYQKEHADPNAVYDLLSSQRSQKYLGVEYLDRSGRRLAGESASSRRAVALTEGLVCKRHDELFCTYYSAVCGGRTTDGRFVFKDASEVLRSVPCEWCRDSPHYRWTAEVSREEFQRRVFNQNTGHDRQSTIRVVSERAKPSEGRITEFEFDDGKRRQILSGIDLRERLPIGTLASPHFKIQLGSQVVKFEGRGHGHGVGFCQWGAKGQAESGKKDRDIVCYYYPGAEIVKLNYSSTIHHEIKD
jgi:stage II sporulation protein D